MFRGHSEILLWKLSDTRGQKWGLIVPVTPVCQAQPSKIQPYDNFVSLNVTVMLKVFQLTEWRFCWAASRDPEVQSAPPCCSWPWSPQPGRCAVWGALPRSCSHWWRRAAPGKPGRASATGAASVPDAPTAEGCQRRAQTLSFGWISPQLHPSLQSSHICTMELSVGVMWTRRKL